MRSNLFLLTCLLILSQAGISQTPEFLEPELVFVAGGDFRLGCLAQNDTACFSDEKPAINVTLYDYWIGKYEITNEQYAIFLTEEGNQVEGNSPWYIMDDYALIKEEKGGKFVSKKGTEKHPVNNITWYGARAYAAWLSRKTNKNYRLPTEAEWEYAARGGQKSKGYQYAGSNSLEEIGWTFEYAIGSKVGWDFEEKAGTFPVGQKKPNELGIYDMTGNLSEWVQDAYDHRYKGGINPSGPATGGYRIVRGGSWDHEDVEARNTSRTRATPINSFHTNKGFRVAMEKDYFSRLEMNAEKYEMNGIVLIKKGDEVIYHKGFGVNDADKGTPMVKETPFTIMSITKTFSAALILQLMEEGKIDLNQTISTYLPNYMGAGADVVTIHQLLNHTSGIQAGEVAKESDGETPSMYANRYSTDQLLEQYCSGPLVSEPGSKFDYSNGDYIILGKIIEQVENDTYEKVLHRRILDPLGMENSGLITDENFETLNLDFPIGYTWDSDNESLSEDEPVFTQNFYASGAMYSTVTDLAKFSDALFLHSTLLRASSMQQLLQTYPEGNLYGYGLWVRFKERGKQVIKLAQRPGRNLGINTMLCYVFDHDLSIILFLNSDKINIDGLTSFLQKQILESSE